MRGWKGGMVNPTIQSRNTAQMITDCNVQHLQGSRTQVGGFSGTNPSRRGPVEAKSVEESRDADSHARPGRPEKGTNLIRAPMRYSANRVARG